MKVIIIVATAKNRAIGKDNQLLWHLPLDMAFFRRSTTGHMIITGRKNYESIPEKYRPLKGRTNIVITRQSDYQASGAVVVNSIDSALEYAKQQKEERLYIIGGGQIYSDFLSRDLVDEMLITHVDAEYDADVYFPEFNKDQWKSETISHFEKDEKHKVEFQMVRYTKI